MKKPTRPPPDSPQLRKERGAFFTPPELSTYLVRWAIRSGEERVLEPSCGEASFMIAAAQRLASLRACAPAPEQLHGIELHEESAQTARRLLKEENCNARIRVSDFFAVEPAAEFDVVVGNPPYIRYQSFRGDLRAKALHSAQAEGVRLSRLASSWAAFVVHATRFLKAHGRLALVLPAELLTVNYAAPVRRFLLERFAKVRLVMFAELVFPGVLEEVVLLQAEGRGPTDHLEVYQANGVSELCRLERQGWTTFQPEGGGKWSPALLSADALSAYQELVRGQGFAQLLDWGETYLGAVTGNNDYFCLNRQEVERRGLPESALLRISPPGSRHLRGLSFGAAAWKEASAAGAACYLLQPGPGEHTAALRSYIAHGERAGVQRAYKCRMRLPWWRVPVVPIADLFLTYMDQDRPRLITNSSKLAHLNSLYGVLLKPGLRRLGRELLPLSALNSLTLLGAEMVGRSYGGGLLKLEPKEADHLPVPQADLLARLEKRLRSLRTPVAALLEQGAWESAVELIDQPLLREGLGLSAAKLEVLRRARRLLHERRKTRGKGRRGQG